jgi:hypothetical protein
MMNHSIETMSRHLILSGLLLLIQCSSQPLSRTMIPPVSEGESSSEPEAAYLEARTKRTIVLSAGRGESPRFMLPGSPGRMRGGDFPLMVTATLMDDRVVKAGFLFYETALGMTSEEAAEFQRKYRTTHETDQYFLIEASLQTAMAENYLDLDRWTIFIEDDEGSQNIPARITELPVSSQVMAGSVEDPVRKRPMPVEWTRHRKTVLLYFPRKDYYGKPLLPENLKTLTLVFLLEKGGRGRGQGTWVF